MDYSSVINLDTLGQDKIAQLQTKFDKLNQPLCALKVNREHSVAEILKNMEKEKILELRKKFESMNLKRASRMSDLKLSIEEQKRKQRVSMNDFRKARESIEQNILAREMLIFYRQNAPTQKNVKIHERRKTAKLKPKHMFRLPSFGDETQDEVQESSCDLLYRKIVKNQISFLMWRVENQDLIPVVKENIGTFYDHECYIIYVCVPYGENINTCTLGKEIKGKVENNVHFWYGEFATLGKCQITAFKAVDIDNYLGESCTQFMESQGIESPRFKSYFSEGIRVFYGSPDAGTNEVEDIFMCRLYNVKGIQAPILTEMPEIDWKFFTSGDVMLLHTKKIIFVWVGRSAHPVEKLLGAKAAMRIKKQYDTSTIVIVDDGYEKTLFQDDREVFEIYLDPSERVVKAADDLECIPTSQLYQYQLKLYKCSEVAGKYRVVEINTAPLSQKDLDRNYVMLLDHGINGVYMWMGKNVVWKERLEAIRNARGFIKSKKLPFTTSITRVIDGYEPNVFKRFFLDWVDEPEHLISEGSYMKKKIPVVKITKFDANTMYERPALAAKSQLVDDGSGKLRIWRIKRYECIELLKERFGIFFTSDCYLIMYSYKVKNVTKYMIYYWLGFHSIKDEQGITLLKSIEIDAKYCDRSAVHGRIYQGRETAHFLQLFKGRMRIFSGRGTDFDASGKNILTPTHYMLLIQGTNSYNTKAVQVSLKAQSLNSNYCFVVRKGTFYYIWCGCQSTGDNREMAKGFVGTDFVLLLEGKETSEFWSAIYGKHDHKSPKLPEFKEETRAARLYFSSTFALEEIMHFKQKDLIVEGVMLLDAFSVLYIWLGKESVSEDKVINYEIAYEYLKAEQCGRDTETTVMQVKQGCEPPTFTGFFESWDPDAFIHWTFEEIREKIETRVAPSRRFTCRNATLCVSDFDKLHKYSLTTLRGPAENLPPTVDPLRKELHLTYDDFVSIFRMDIEEFDKIPLWKKQEMKKEVGLF